MSDLRTGFNECEVPQTFSSKFNSYNKRNKVDMMDIVLRRLLQLRFYI